VGLTHNCYRCCATTCPLLTLQSPKLLALKAQLDDAAKEQASLAQQVASLQGERDKAAEQLKKLAADKACMQKQLGSSADDINLLQVG
jgi:predicted nuclease with TOPRIM domain